MKQFAEKGMAPPAVEREQLPVEKPKGRRREHAKDRRQQAAAKNNHASKQNR